MRRFATFAVTAMLVAACAQGGPGPSTAADTATATGPGPSVSAVSGDFSGAIDIGGYSLYLDCRGEGSPVVILDAGLGSDPYVWNTTRSDLQSTTRVCYYARPGLSPSRSRPIGVAPKEGLTAGFMADEEHRMLAAAGIPGPYVVVGHSYGGMIARLFAFAHPDETVGVVLVDSASAHQFEGAWLAGDEDWLDGAVLVNRPATKIELDAITSLGHMPLVVLTQGDTSGDFEIHWSHFQDELATLSTNSLHMVANPSGHVIMKDQEALVVESIRAVVEAARVRQALPACDERFTALHAVCLDPTMTARLERWDAERAAVKPTPGAFPSGTYLETLTDADVKAVTGEAAGFSKAELTWVLGKGHWSVSIVIDGAQPEIHDGVYAATDELLTLVIPLDWKVPQTSGVTQLRWTKGLDGTIHFEQIDDWPREADWTVPFVRVAAP